MVKQESLLILSDEAITSKIYIIREKKVMLDRDIAELYQVDTKVLKQAVKRNLEIFPNHFMFEMNDSEFENWRSQFVTSNSDKMGLRYKPFCFTEHGVLQTANILKSSRAKQISIRIIEVFVKIREVISAHNEIRLEIEHIKKKINNHDKNIELVFQYLDELLMKKENPKTRTQIGYKLPNKK